MVFHMSSNDNNLNSVMKYICGPMVNQSDAPFRALCLKYGTTCVYSQMFGADDIATKSSETFNFVDNCIPDIDHTCFNNMGYATRPLVMQINGNNPENMAKCVAMIYKSKRVDAIDFNLGCPQERARVGLYGSYLLDFCHWAKVMACVKAMTEELRRCAEEHGDAKVIPLFCKIRIIETKDPLIDTIDFCKRLIDSGASLVCIHGRKRGSVKLRRCGPADLEMVGSVVAHFQHHTMLKRVFDHNSNNNLVEDTTVFATDQSKETVETENKTCVSNARNSTVPFVANGNIVSRDDVFRALSAAAPVVGVMSAEGILRDPAIFAQAYNQDIANAATLLEVNGRTNTVSVTGSDSSDGSAGISLSSAKIVTIPDRNTLFQEYCDLSELYEQAGGWTAKHITDPEYSHISVGDNALQPEAPAVHHPQHRQQIFVARQHLTWMLGKTGHGRCVRYEHLGTYKKHTQLLNALNEAMTIAALREISANCLVGVQGSMPYSSAQDT